MSNSFDAQRGYPPAQSQNGYSLGSRQAAPIVRGPQSGTGAPPAWDGPSARTPEGPGSRVAQAPEQSGRQAPSRDAGPAAWGSAPAQDNWSPGPMPSRPQQRADDQPRGRFVDQDDRAPSGSRDPYDDPRDRYVDDPRDREARPVAREQAVPEEYGAAPEHHDRARGERPRDDYGRDDYGRDDYARDGRQDQDAYRGGDRQDDRRDDSRFDQAAERDERPAPPAASSGQSEDALTIGRGRNNSIVLDDMLVSRQHVQISADDYGLLIEDLGSRNGTFVNGRRIDRSHLHEGDRIGIGASTFEVRDGWLVSI